MRSPLLASLALLVACHAASQDAASSDDALSSDAPVSIDASYSGQIGDQVYFVSSPSGALTDTLGAIGADGQVSPVTTLLANVGMPVEHAGALYSPIRFTDGIGTAGLWRIDPTTHAHTQLPLRLDGNRQELIPCGGALYTKGSLGSLNEVFELQSVVGDQATVLGQYGTYSAMHVECMADELWAWLEWNGTTESIERFKDGQRIDPLATIPTADGTRLAAPFVIDGKQYTSPVELVPTLTATEVSYSSYLGKIGSDDFFAAGSKLYRRDATGTVAAVATLPSVVQHSSYGPSSAVVGDRLFIATRNAVYVFDPAASALTTFGDAPVYSSFVRTNGDVAAYCTAKSLVTLPKTGPAIVAPVADGASCTGVVGLVGHTAVLQMTDDASFHRTLRTQTMN